MADYTRGGKRLHMAYSFEMLSPEFTARHFRRASSEFFKAAPDGWPCWTFSNHDVIRHVTAGRSMRRTDALARQAAALLLSPAGVGLPLPGRGAGPRGERARLRGADRPARDPLLARLQGPRRLPDADGLGRRQRGERASRPASPGCRSRRRRRRVTPPGRRRTRPRCSPSTARCSPGGGRGRCCATGGTRFLKTDEPVLAFLRQGGRGDVGCAFNLSAETRVRRCAGSRSPRTRRAKARASSGAG